MKPNTNNYNFLQLKGLKESSMASQFQGRFITTMRKFLGMSIKELAQRLNLTTATVQQMEKRECTGRITIETLTKLAEVMNCEFQYSFVPKSEINDYIFEEAKKKAISLLNKTQVHMELEDQKAPENIINRVDLLALELIKKGKVWSWISILKIEMAQLPLIQI